MKDFKKNAYEKRTSLVKLLVNSDINFEIKKHIFVICLYEIFALITESIEKRTWELTYWPNHAIKVKRALLLKIH